MKYALKTPRLIVPSDDFRRWSVIACDQFTSDRAYWKRVEETVGTCSSTLRFILPECFLEDDDREERIQKIHEEMYCALERGACYKLPRGCMLVERYTSTGIRRGILAAIDLEEYTYRVGDESLVRSSEAVVPDRLPPRVEVRRGSLLEFPHALVFFKDKKNKIIPSLLEEELEQVYDFELMEGGGRVRGRFVPEEIAEDVLQELYSRGDPCFAVADGNHSVAAAKAYWEELKPELSESERRMHPARFTLVELINVYDPAVRFYPIHRLVKAIDKEALCDFIMRSIPCKRKGDVLYPEIRSAAEVVEKTDELIEKFIRVNTGRIDYIHGDTELLEFAKEENSVGIYMPTLEKDDFFPALKGGKNFPKKTFSIGEANEKRYYLEGKEISYD